ncbi:hypothetical protein ACNPKZ_20170 [Shewanella algae]|uniref:hypothetical protein n=1 Tax=Shewanella algae TaxID=38313 RepID=UPI000B346B8C|nr:hypothetical protein KVP08_022695 [Shewanella putrefaciens]
MFACVEELVAKTQAVPVSSLKVIRNVRELNEDWVQWAKRFCKEKQCFSNALNMSLIDGCSLVIGYVYLPSFGLAIEHAWNRDCEGDFDLTAQIFWGQDKEPAQYVELLCFEEGEAHEWRNKGGVDHLKLRMSNEYRHVFKQS